MLAKAVTPSVTDLQQSLLLCNAVFGKGQRLLLRDVR